MERIEPIRSLMDITAGRIRSAIISGALPLGSKLSEQRLADQLGISRSPVRDALALLQTEGLVEVQPKVGSFVFTPDLSLALDLCEHRVVLEAASLRMAIKSNHTALLDGLTRGTEVMEAAAASGDRAAYTRGDMMFHNAIIEAGGNRSIGRAYPHTIGPLMALRTHLFTALNAQVGRSLAEHAMLIEACRDKDLDRAAAILRAHVFHLIEDYQGVSDAAPVGSRAEG